MLHKRLSSPFLDDSSYSQNLVEQFHDVEGFCGTSIPLNTATPTLFQGTVGLPSITATIGVPASTTCTGQLVQPTAPYWGCRNVADAYGVPDGEIVVVTQSQDCKFTEPICLPEPCELDYVGWDNTW